MKLSRSLVALALLSLTAGCIVVPPQPTGEPPPPPAGAGPPIAGGGGQLYDLVLEGVDLDPSFGSGYPPDIFVRVFVDGSEGDSSESYGTFDPVWNEPLIEADDVSFSDGIDLQVWADDGGGPALMGELQFPPGPADFDGSTIDLGSFDYVADARISLQAQ